MYKNFDVVSALVYSGIYYNPHLKNEESHSKACEVFESLTPGDRHYVYASFIVSHAYGREFDLRIINDAIVQTIEDEVREKIMMPKTCQINDKTLWQFISSCHSTARLWNDMNALCRGRIIQRYFTQ